MVQVHGVSSRRAGVRRRSATEIWDRNWMRLWILVFLIVMAGTGNAPAQTAQFGYAITTSGGGSSSNYVLTLDSYGNVYVPYYDLSVENTSGYPYGVKEIPAGCGSSNCVETRLDFGFGAITGLAVDSTGNVYVADGPDETVGEIPAGCTSSACVKTLVSQIPIPSGLAIDGRSNIYVTTAYDSAESSLSKSVVEIPAGCTALSCVTTLGGGFNYPAGVAVDRSGNVYVTDSGNSLVKVIPLSCILGGNNSSCVLTLGGGFYAPMGVAVDDIGNIYVSDTGNNAVKEIPISCIGGSNNSSCVEMLGAGFSKPNGVALDSSGNIYVGDWGNNTVKEISWKDVQIGSEPVGSTGPAQALYFTFTSDGTIGVPVALTMGAPNLDFAVANGGTCVSGSSFSAGQTCTVDVTFTPKYAGARDGAVELVNSSGAVITTAYIYGAGTGPQVAFPPGVQSLAVASGLNQPYGVAVDGAGNLYIADTGNDAVHKYAPSGSGYTQLGDVANGLNQPYGVAVDGAGNVYVADSGNNAIHEYAPSGSGYTQLADVANGLNQPFGVAVDGAGNVYIADAGNNAVHEYAPSGSGYTRLADVVNIGLNFPSGVAVDGSGNVYVADTFNNAVHKYAPSGNGYRKQADVVNTGLNYPYGVAVDRVGNVYVPDTDNGAVHKYAPSGGGYTQLADVGSGLNSPTGAAVDAAGNVYIANRFSIYGTANHVVKLDVSDAPSLRFATTNVGAISSDSPQTVTIQNIGNATLTFPIPSSGDNPGVSVGFTYDNGSTCLQSSASAQTAFTLAAGASCKVAIDFEPTTAGSISGNLVLTNDNLNAATPNYASQNIGISGTANAGSTSTTVTSSANPSAYGQSITFTAAVTDISGANAMPTGAVQFAVDGTNIGSAVALANGDATETISTLAAGTHTVSAAYTNTDGNFTNSNGSLSGVQTVNKVVATVSQWPTASAITYGQTLVSSTLSGGAASYNGSMVSGTFAWTSPSTTPGAGTQTAFVTFTPIDTTDYDTITGTVTLTVTAAPLTITVQSSSRVYGAANPILTGTVSGLVNGDSASSVGLMYSTTAAANSAVGAYPITASINSSNYALNVTPGTLTVTSARLVVTASSGTMTYGGVVPTISPTYMGFVGGDTSASLTTEPACSTTATSRSAVGSYPASCSGAVDANYTISYITGSVDVAKALLNITASGGSMAYGGTVPAITPNYSGFTGGDTAASLIAQPTCSTLATSTSPVGSYSSTCAGAADPNYAITYASGSVSVTRAILTVTAANTSTIYGTVPAVSPSYTGFVAGNTPANLTAAASCSSTVVSTTPVGTYSGANTCSGTADPNYDFNYVAGTALVKQGTLILTANNATRIYGMANPSFTGNVTGAQKGDAFTESFSTSATVSSPVGAYAIVPSVAGTNLADYTQSANDGTLTIAQAASATTLHVNTTAATPGQSVTLTAAVASSTSGTPTGAVNFYDNGAPLNASPEALSGGVAVFTTAALSAGASHIITATYSGDVNFRASSSTAGAATTVTIAPLDFAMTLISPSNLTVMPGQSASWQIQVKPDYGSYAGTVSFAAAGLPPGATAKFSPSTIAANGGPQTITVTVETSPAAAMLHRQPPTSPRRKAFPVALGLLLLFGVDTMRKRGKALRGLLVLLVLIGAGGTAMTISGCGAETGFFAQGPQNYTVTLTATAENLQHVSTITLNVQ